MHLDFFDSMTKTVLIFHPDIELSLVRFQRELSKSLNLSVFQKLDSDKNSFSSQNKFPQTESFFYSPLPLWLELNHDDFVCKNKSQLKKLAADIKNVSLLENLKVFDNSVYITAKIVLAKKQNSPENSTSPENCEFFFDLPVSTFHNCKNITEENLKIIRNTKNPIKNIKIFKLGICKQISENTKEIEDFVWAKKNS